MEIGARQSTTTGSDVASSTCRRPMCHEAPLLLVDPTKEKRAGTLLEKPDPVAPRRPGSPDRGCPHRPGRRAGLLPGSASRPGPGEPAPEALLTPDFWVGTGGGHAHGSPGEAKGAASVDAKKAPDISGIVHRFGRLYKPSTCSFAFSSVRIMKPFQRRLSARHCREMWRPLQPISELSR